MASRWPLAAAISNTENTMSSGRHLFKGSFSSDEVDLDHDALITSIVWKRRSGFAQFSDTIIGAGTSWEKRRITLHHDPTTKKKQARVCYYAVDGDTKTPRGTVYLKSERAVVWANHHPSDGTQPTPYSISVLPDGGTKWKFCFADRKTQMAWLVALTDIIVEESVREYNARILLKEASNWDHGGFHRLYEEGTQGLFESMRGTFEVVGTVTEKSKRTKIIKTPSKDSFEVVKAKSEKPLIVDTNSPSKSVADSGTQTTKKKISSLEDEILGLGISSERIFQAFLIVNLSVIYVYMTAQSTSFIAVPWWQLLMVMNAVIYYVCMTPKGDNEKHQNDVDEGNDSWVSHAAKFNEVQSRDAGSNRADGDDILGERVSVNTVTKSSIGMTLLRSEDVPLSEVPTELSPQQKVKSEYEPQRTERLSEAEMSAHLHERWAMSAPNCDLSGSWTLIADDSFKAEYDTYLKQLGFSRITRGVACSLIARTTEITKQSKSGRELYLKGVNPKGAWERVLVASGYPDFETRKESKDGTDYTHMKTSIKTADAEDVDAEAWWEERGTMHRSWLRGGTKYGGGDFESLRYLEEGSGGNVLVCDSQSFIILWC